MMKREVVNANDVKPILVEMKLPRIAKVDSTFKTEEVYEKSQELLREFIENNKETKTNYFYEYLGGVECDDKQNVNILDPRKILGYMDDFDEDYIYCRVFEDKLDYIKDTYRMCGLYVGELNNGNPICRRFVRMEFKDVENRRCGDV